MIDLASHEEANELMQSARNVGSSLRMLFSIVTHKGPRRPGDLSGACLLIGGIAGALAEGFSETAEIHRRQHENSCLETPGASSPTSNRQNEAHGDQYRLSAMIQNYRDQNARLEAQVKELQQGLED